MSEPLSPDLETDPRFPSGPWTGFFLDKRLPGKHRMELRLTFRQGTLTGEGRDFVGQFLVRGEYDAATGQCHWTKKYLSRHDVFYKGYGEGKGIWGVWELTDAWLTFKGGFHIWPEGLPDPSEPHLAEAIELPAVETAGTALLLAWPRRAFAALSPLRAVGVTVHGDRTLKKARKGKRHRH